MLGRAAIYAFNEDHLFTEVMQIALIEDVQWDSEGSDQVFFRPSHTMFVPIGTYSFVYEQNDGVQWIYNLYPMVTITPADRGFWLTPNRLGTNDATFYVVGIPYTKRIPFSAPDFLEQAGIWSDVGQ